jgi:hypothetical protein
MAGFNPITEGSSSLKRGCGEGAIVNGFTDMIKEHLSISAQTTSARK